MKPDNVVPLPIWKVGSTAEEFFLELANLARAYPERFNRVVVVYEEKLPSGNVTARQTSNNLNTKELLGLIEMAKIDVYMATCR